jgi:hypothetical protein
VDRKIPLLATESLSLVFILDDAFFLFIWNLSAKSALFDRTLYLNFIWKQVKQGRSKTNIDL